MSWTIVTSNNINENNAIHEMRLSFLSAEWTWKKQEFQSYESCRSSVQTSITYFAQVSLLHKQLWRRFLEASLRRFVHHLQPTRASTYNILEVIAEPMTLISIDCCNKNKTAWSVKALRVVLWTNPCGMFAWNSIIRCMVFLEHTQNFLLILFY